MNQAKGESFTPRECQALRLWLEEIMYSDPFKELLDADWEDSEAEHIIKSIGDKIGLEVRS